MEFPLYSRLLKNASLMFVIYSAVLSPTVLAATESDIFVILSEDARSYVFKQSVVSDKLQIDYALPENLSNTQLVFVDNKDETWERINNRISFKGGSFSLMYRHHFTDEIDSENNLTFNFSSPQFSNEGGYEFFSYTWILPETMEVTTYSSNITSSTWQQSENILRYTTRQNNNIQLHIQFRRKNVENETSAEISEQISPPLQASQPEVVEPSVAPEVEQEPEIEAQSEVESEIQTDIASKGPHTTEPDNTTHCIESEHLSLAAIVCSDQTSVILEQVIFERNSATLTPAVREFLDSLIAPLQNNADKTFEIAAYTDSKGPQDWNRRLSDERAQTVRLYLIFKGVTASQLTAVGYGESDPVANNNTSEGREKNRRIELKLVK